MIRRFCEDHLPCLNCLEILAHHGTHWRDFPGRRVDTPTGNHWVPCDRVQQQGFGVGCAPCLYEGTVCLPIHPLLRMDLRAIFQRHFAYRAAHPEEDVVPETRDDIQRLLRLHRRFMGIELDRYHEYTESRRR